MVKTTKLNNVANKVHLNSNTKAKNFVQKVTGLSSRTSSNVAKKVDVKGISKQLSNGIKNATTKNSVDKLKDKINE
ncbi:hypothetical protein [Chryseobacterium cucumeris]|uniref:hypothetical protein n=1 Tax=Chryseobacterium cucumeris TaxID=1813611 RepID=UPI001041BFC0|nr:hypothetical protein [Chryseobacterium cucumeris]